MPRSRRPPAVARPRLRILRLLICDGNTGVPSSGTAVRRCAQASTASVAK
jgi:hypothetical protein